MIRPRLVLASSSPYRKQLLERLGLEFDVVKPDVDEGAKPGEAADALVERLAIAKAQTVAQHRHGALVIGADQVAVQNGHIVGKPCDHAQAVRYLQRASGQSVILYTGLALTNSDSGRTQSDVIPFRVVFRELSEQQIESYLQREQPYDCAGGVKAEGLGIALLQRLEGDDPNALIGLPLIRLVQMLEQENVSLI
ncbi:MAG: Maf family protein [Acidiferrobacterales bacterium]